MTRKKPKRRAVPKDVPRPARQRNVVPDRLDLRDRPYLPPVALIPGSELKPKSGLPVLNQRNTNACTGFALASIVYHLLCAAKRDAAEWKVSAFMLYSMARRYDEFPGAPTADTGSSLRGAMKGWYKHGVCSNELWKTEKMPPTPSSGSPANDWWLDAVKRPLGAYYRIETRSVTDMHVALNEVEILYASAVCHSGWDKGFDIGKKPKEGYWIIPPQKAAMDDGGHAIAIVGYNRNGFIIHNSWGKEWGSSGRAILTYEDWLENAMDCWVAQLGVVTELHREIAHSKSLRVEGRKVQLASDATLRHREISPFIIDMENNGRLSNTGEFRTQQDDVKALVNQHLEIARAKWNLSKTDPVDIAIYAHGGLTSENTAADTAATWIPALYNNKIFPIFLMWETGLWSTLKDRLEDIVAGQTRTTGGLMEGLKNWWNERLEKLLAAPGTAIWGEMKQNADALSGATNSGGMLLYKECEASPLFKPAIVRLHLIGHSAGAIVHSHAIQRLTALGWKFETVNFMAPAVRVDTFEKTVFPSIISGAIRQYNQFHLTDETELKDPTCKPILGYSRSLLYLVSRSFEKGEVTPILGMQKYFEALMIKKGSVQVLTAPGAKSQSTTHGGFDEDATTMASIISLIRNSGK